MIEMSVNRIIFGVDGENWTWTWVGWLYLLVRYPCKASVRGFGLTTILTMTHFFDHTAISGKYIKTNISYGYEIGLVILAIIVCFLLFVKTRSDKSGRFLFWVVFTSNAYRFLVSGVARTVQGTWLDLAIKVM